MKGEARKLVLTLIQTTFSLLIDSVLTYRHGYQQSHFIACQRPLMYCYCL